MHMTSQLTNQNNDAQWRHYLLSNENEARALRNNSKCHLLYQKFLNSSSQGFSSQFPLYDAHEKDILFIKIFIFPENIFFFVAFFKTSFFRIFDSSYAVFAWEWRTTKPVSYSLMFFVIFVLRKSREEERRYTSPLQYYPGQVMEKLSLGRTQDPIVLDR